MKHHKEQAPEELHYYKTILSELLLFKQHFLQFLPLSQGQGLFQPFFSSLRTGEISGIYVLSGTITPVWVVQIALVWMVS